MAYKDITQSIRTEQENLICFEKRLDNLMDDFYLPISLREDLNECLKLWIKINNKVCENCKI